jgi:hypothetical protein
MQVFKAQWHLALATPPTRYSIVPAKPAIGSWLEKVLITFPSLHSSKPDLPKGCMRSCCYFKPPYQEIAVQVKYINAASQAYAEDLQLARSFIPSSPSHSCLKNKPRTSCRVLSCLVCPRHNSKSPHSDIILSCGLSRARQPQPSYNRSRSLRSTACQLKALSFLSIIKIPYHAHQTTCLKIQKVAFPSFAENPPPKYLYLRRNGSGTTLSSPRCSFGLRLDGYVQMRELSSIYSQSEYVALMDLSHAFGGW